MLQRATRVTASLLAVATLTVVAHFVLNVNAATVGFAYLLLVLAIATAWGFPEAAAASLAATLTFNFYFLPPEGTLTISDPANWVALFSFLTTSLVASRLSVQAKRRAQEAIARERDLEQLYTFSRAILLANSGEPLPRQLVHKLADAFSFEAVVLFDRRTDDIYRAGPAEFAGMEKQLREAALNGTSFFSAEGRRAITAVRLGSNPIASIALQGEAKQDSVLQGIANLVAIGLERARAQELTLEMEAARQSDQLRTTLIDAMAHEFKTPLTSIKAATTSLLTHPAASAETREALLQVADEEADHLRQLIDDAVDMARLDAAQLDMNTEPINPAELIEEVIAPLRSRFEGRQVNVVMDGAPRSLHADRRLVKLALKQLLENALKYSPPDTPVSIRLIFAGDGVALEVTDQGKGIPRAELGRLFDRFYRSPDVRHRIPGSGLGLTIAQSVMRAHKGDLTVRSHPGETTFRMSFPNEMAGASA